MGMEQAMKGAATNDNYIQWVEKLGNMGSGAMVGQRGAKLSHEVRVFQSLSENGQATELYPLFGVRRVLGESRCILV